MKRKQKVWVFHPEKASKPKLPENIKIKVEIKAKKLVESFLKPKYIKPPPEDRHFNYIVDIYTKWYRNYFYFCAKYCSISLQAIEPYFEIKFARMEYVGNSIFNLSYMRHTGQYLEIYKGLSVDECLASIKDDPNFLP